MVSRVAVGFHAPRTGLGFLFSLISQSPLKFHISCYEIWHTSGLFPPFLGSSQLSADSLREPAALPPSIPLGIVLDQHHSSPMVCRERAVLSIPSAPSGRC